MKFVDSGITISKYILLATNESPNQIYGKNKEIIIINGLNKLSVQESCISQ